MHTCCTTVCTSCVDDVYTTNNIILATMLAGKTLLNALKIPLTGAISLKAYPFISCHQACNKRPCGYKMADFLSALS